MNHSFREKLPKTRLKLLDKLINVYRRDLIIPGEDVQLKIFEDESGSLYVVETPTKSLHCDIETGEYDSSLGVQNYIFIATLVHVLKDDEIKEMNDLYAFILKMQSNRSAKVKVNFISEDISGFSKTSQESYIFAKDAFKNGTLRFYIHNN